MNKASGNIILDKTFVFSLKIIAFCRWLSEDKTEFVLSRQLMKSGTSIGANVREAQEAESKADFIHKFSISNKEASETIYWLDLIHSSGLSEGYENFSEMVDLSKEIKGIITTIVKSSKRKE